MKYRKYKDYHRINEQGIEEKQCKECLKWFEMNENNFGIDNGNKDGFNMLCKTCLKKNNQKYYSENKENLKENVTIVKDGKGFCNEYKIDEDITYIYIVNRKKEEFKILIDTEDLQRLIDFDCNWHVRYDEDTGEYYVRAIKITYYENNKIFKKKIKTILMQRFIMNVTSNKVVVDHHNHNRLDNRKENLFITEHTNNSTHRKGANRNNNTGVRNVSYIERDNVYWVQFMKKGERFRWEFPGNQFKEACEFAEEKRKELFGEFAGNA